MPSLNFSDRTHEDTPLCSALRIIDALSTTLLPAQIFLAFQQYARRGAIMVLRVVVESRESLRMHGAGHATGLTILPALTSRLLCRRVHCCRLPLLVHGGKVYRSTQPPWCSLLISRGGAWHVQRLARFSSSCTKFSRATSPFSSTAPRPVHHRAAQCQGGRYWRDRVLTCTRREATSFRSTDDGQAEALPHLI